MSAATLEHDDIDDIDPVIARVLCQQDYDLTTVIAGLARVRTMSAPQSASNARTADGYDQSRTVLAATLSAVNRVVSEALDSLDTEPKTAPR